MKKVLLSVLVFAAAFAAASFFLVGARAQMYDASGNLIPGTSTNGAANTTGTGAAATGTTSTTPGLPNTGGGGAAGLK